MLVPVVVELMQQHLKLSSWLKPWVNLNLPWAEPSAIGLVLAVMGAVGGRGGNGALHQPHDGRKPGDPVKRPVPLHVRMGGDDHQLRAAWRQGPGVDQRRLRPAHGEDLPGGSNYVPRNDQWNSNYHQRR